MFYVKLILFLLRRIINFSRMMMKERVAQFFLKSDDYKICNVFDG